MRIFLQGQINAGKSTVISKTLDILANESPIELGGFFTWNSGDDAPEVFMRPAKACTGAEVNVHKLASFDPDAGRMRCDLSVFELIGTRFLDGCDGADIIIMDELGYMESNAPAFRAAVMRALKCGARVLGTMRLGDVPWLNEIKQSVPITLIDVNEKNRDDLPQKLAHMLRQPI